MNKNINLIKDDDLLIQTRKYVTEERGLLKQILLNLKEIDARKLFLKRGYSSMFTYCTRALGYSESAAQRRVDAMRAIKEIPEIANKIAEGKLTLSSVSLVQRVIRQEQKSTSVVIEKSRKESIFKSIERKSSKESEKVLAKEFPQVTLALRSDATRALTENQSEVRFVADEKLLKKLELIKHKFSHKNASPSYNELLHLMADQVLAQPKMRKATLKKNDSPKIDQHSATSMRQQKVQKDQHSATSMRQQKVQKDQHSATSMRQQKVQKDQHSATSMRQQKVQKDQRSATSMRQGLRRNRYISLEVKRELYKRDKGVCQYVDPKTKVRCGSKHFIQVDHIWPFSYGGESDLDNLQLLCFGHNQFKGCSLAIPQKR